MNAFDWFWYSLKNLEISFIILLNLHYCCNIIASVAIVWCAPYGDKVFILSYLDNYFEPKLISFLNQLMGPRNQVKVVDMAEVTGNFGSEDPSGSSSIDRPILYIFGIRPHQITERTFMGDLNSSVNSPDLINCLDLRWEASVNTQNFPINNST